MAPGERVVRVVLVVADEVAIFTYMTKGIHPTSAAYRIPKISLEVSKSMGRENLLMDMEGIRDPGATELLRETACKLNVHLLDSMTVDKDSAWG